MSSAAGPARPSLAPLAAAAAYPGDPSARRGVEWLQTHISDVFLTGERVYKFRKPVRFGFVCFADLAERNEDCLRELRLNRRLAPDVYLGVAPLLSGAGLRVGPPAEELSDPAGEHCVVMRRLPEGRDALSLLRAGSLSLRQLDRLARRVAAFHARYGLGEPAPFSPSEWRERCSGPFRDSLQSMASRDLPDEALSTLRTRARARADALAESFEARRLAGRAVDGHGDLHLDHVWFETDDAEPLCIDCLEFDPRLRRIDAAADVAFLAMDLRYRGRPELGERFLRCYARERGDEDLYAVVDYFASYRAAVRAKVAALAAEDAAIGPEQRRQACESAGRHLTLATQLLAPSPVGAVVLVGGVVGTGKTTLAEALAERLDARGGAAVLSSDRVRKQGAAPSAAPADVDRGAYTQEARSRVYRELLARARRVVGAGRTAILDATWSRRTDRGLASALAAELGASCLFVEARCAEACARERLARRQASGTSLSDAGPAFYDVSRERFEAWRAGEEIALRVVHTDRPDWPHELDALAAELATAGVGSNAPVP